MLPRVYGHLIFTPILGIVATITLQSQPVVALERAEIAAKVKEHTVSIEGDETSGTGTIIDREGNSYTVLTAWHVVNVETGFRVTTVDGVAHEVSEVKNIEGIDLAVVKFTSDLDYSLAELGDSQTIAEGASSYVVGYPDPIPGIPERAYTFLDLSVISKLNTGENGYRIVHNNPTTGGSSGGGVFDSNGILIGINGRTTSDAEGKVSYGLAIPINIYLEEQANLTTPDTFSPPQDFVSQGRRKLQQEDYQGAIADFSQALASNSNDLDALSGRAEAYYWQGDFTAAIQDLNRVLEQNDNNATYFFYRGYAHQKLKEEQQAIADYTEAIRLDPQDALAYNNRGNSYSRLGEDQQAIADYTEAIRLDPQYAEAYYNRGLIYKKLNNKEKAILDFQKSADLDRQQGNIEYYQEALNHIRQLQ